MATRGSSDNSDWRIHFARLDELPKEANKTEKQQRGYGFERVLRAMFACAGMEPRSSFRPSGEEIDGSIIFQGRPMLFEAKWTKDPIPASALYQFKGKLDGKLTGTLGIFISMSGYSADAVDALVTGKSLNLILFNDIDIRELARPGGMGIMEAITLKLRVAAEEGTPLFPISSHTRLEGPTSQQTLFVVEGAYDLMVVMALAERSLSRSGFVIVPAGGPRNIAPVALAQLKMHSKVSRLVVIVDGDGRADRTRDEVLGRLQSDGFPTGVELDLIVVDPTLESVLGIANTHTRRPQPERLPEVIRALDVASPSLASGEVRKLFDLLGLST